MSNFLMGAKSTIDATAKAIADAQGWEFASLDSTDSYETLLASEANAVIWEFGDLAPNPFHPLYDLQFFIGAKTVSDAGGYSAADLLQDVMNELEVGTTVVVNDLSGPTNLGEIGVFYVTSLSLEPQVFDKHAGLRMVRCTAKAQAY